MKKEYLLGIPCSKIKERILNPDIICTSEEQAMGVSAGLILCGKKPTVYMQNSGLGRCIDIITSLYKPYKIPLPKLLLSIRHNPHHHSYIGRITRKLLKLINYNSEICIVEE